jgi:hypothetical protein
MSSMAAAASSFYEIVETASDGSEVPFSKVRDAAALSACLPSAPLRSALALALSPHT